MKKNIKLRPYSEIHNELMKRPGFRKLSNSTDAEYQILIELIKARGHKRLTQRKLAEKMGVPQSSVARFESGRVDASFSFYKKMASALGLRIAIL